MVKDEKPDEPRVPSRRWWGNKDKADAVKEPSKDTPTDKLLSRITLSRRGAITTAAAGVTAVATGGVPAGVVPIPVAAQAVASALKTGQTAGIIAPAVRNLILAFEKVVKPNGEIVEELVAPLSNRVTAETIENFSGRFLECFNGIKDILAHNPLLGNIPLSSLMDESVMRHALESAGESEEYMRNEKTAGAVMREGIHAILKWTGFSGATDEASLGDLYLGYLYNELLERAALFSEDILNHSDLWPTDRAERLKIFKGIGEFLDNCSWQEWDYKYEGGSEALKKRISELAFEVYEQAQTIQEAIDNEEKAKRNTEYAETATYDPEYEKKKLKAKLAKAPYIYCMVKPCDLSENDPPKSKAYLITQAPYGLSTQQLTRMHIQRLRQALFREGKVEGFSPIDTSTLYMPDGSVRICTADEKLQDFLAKSIEDRKDIQIPLLEVDKDVLSRN